MKQLTVFEMEEISGGYSRDFSSVANALSSIICNGAEAIGASILGATAGALAGSAMGGIFGGNGGGILGIGSIGRGGDDLRSVRWRRWWRYCWCHGWLGYHSR